MNRIYKIVLIFALSVVMLCACSKQDNKNSSSDANMNQESVLAVEEQMPPPFKDLPAEAGGDERIPYHTPVNFLLGAIPYELIQSVDVDNFEKWKEAIENEEKDRDDIENSVTLYSFCKHFNISDEQLTSYIKRQMQSDKEGGIVDSWSEEDLNILLMDDETAIRQHFISEYAILANDKIYTPEWIYTHSLKDYEAEEISFDLISSKLSLYEDIPFTSEALTALENKVNSYVKMGLTFEKTAKKEMNSISTAESAAISSETTKSEPNTGGTELGEYRNPYEFFFYGVESRFANLISEEEFDQWLNQFQHVNPSGKRNPYEHNILNFIKEFNISKEDFAKANYVDPENILYTDEEIESLYSNDMAAINLAFMNPDAIYSNGEIYTPEWLDNHSAEDYLKAGISANDLKRVVDQRTSLAGEKYLKGLSKKLDELIQLYNDSDVLIDKKSVSTPTGTTSSATSATQEIKATEQTAVTSETTVTTPDTTVTSAQ